MTLNPSFFLATSLTLLALVGCTGTATLNTSVTPGAAGSKTATGTTGSTTGTGSAAVSTGATVTVPDTTIGTGVAGPLAKLYTVGRKWTYATTASQGGDSSYTDEVTAVANLKASVKRSQTTLAAAAPAIVNFTVDLSQQDAFLATNSDPSVQYQYDASATKQEKITVKAGSYDATHVKGTVKTTKSGANAVTTFEAWSSATVGLIKVIQTTTIDISGAMPAGFTLPAGMTLPGGSGGANTTVTSTTELQSFI
jgi:hypothetical protein